MVKVRIEGTNKDIERALTEFHKAHNILSVSRPYKNRNSVYYRVYIDIELKQRRGEKKND
jgi:hypothetical protein